MYPAEFQDHLLKKVSVNKVKSQGMFFEHWVLILWLIGMWELDTSCEKHERGNGTSSLQGLYNLDHVQRNRFLQVSDK